MQLTQTYITQLTHGPQHHAFTSIAYWRDQWHVAYRKAPTHGITPPGVIEILRITPGCFRDEVLMRMPLTSTLTLADDGPADIRDPRLLASDEALYCLVGAYTPKWPETRLSPHPPWNTIQSYVSYTEDGHTWSPLFPVGRPGYWIWSAVAQPTGWYAAAYHTGLVEETSSLYLLFGDSPLHLRMAALMYDGNSMRRSDPTGSPLAPFFDFAHLSPAEPVLFVVDAQTLGCCVRTETGMEIGVARYPYQDWRWHNTKARIHPSAVVETPYGRLLAGREQAPQAGNTQKPTANTTALFRLDAQYVSAPLLRLPSAYDTGYAGVCATTEPDRYLVSYYSQHLTGTRFRRRLPGSHVFLASITTTA